MEVLLPLVLVLFAATASLAAVRYLAHLPAAPECPRCHNVTTQQNGTGRIDRLCTALAASPVRRCPRCGWAGRMRWRMAGERVPSDLRE